MATGQEYDTESIQSYSTDASIIRTRCNTLQVSVKALSDTFIVVQETYEKLAKNTFKVLNANDEMKEASSDKERLRGREEHLKNVAEILTTCLGVLSRALKDHRKIIEKVVDDHEYDYQYGFCPQEGPQRLNNTFPKISGEMAQDNKATEQTTTVKTRGEIQQIENDTKTRVLKYLDGMLEECQFDDQDGFCPQERPQWHNSSFPEDMAHKQDNAPTEKTTSTSGKTQQIENNTETTVSKYSDDILEEYQEKEVCKTKKSRGKKTPDSVRNCWTPVGGVELQDTLRMKKYSFFRHKRATFTLQQ